MTTSNIAYIQQRIHRLTARGMTAERAIDQVKREMQTSAFVVNGVLVPDRRNLPRDFPDLMLMALDDAYKVFGKQYKLPGPEDLYVEEISDSGRWIILSKSLGNMPVGNGSVVSLADLGTIRGKLKRQAKDAFEGMRAAEQAKREKAASDYKIMNASREKRIERLKKAGGLSAKFGEFLEGVRDREYAERSRWLFETNRNSPRMVAAQKKREEDIKSGKRKGFLEEQGIEVPDFGKPPLNFVWPDAGVSE